MGATMGSVQPANDAVKLVLLLPKTGATPADGCRLTWRAMLFFSASTKGFRCVPMLQGMKNISHNEIQLK